MYFAKVIFSSHAIQRMFERGIDKNDVIQTVKSGQVVEEYDDDKPYPSRLVLGNIDNRIIHVVYASDEETSTAIIITVYIPTTEIWSDDYKHRRQ